MQLLLLCNTCGHKFRNAQDKLKETYDNQLNIAIGTAVGAGIGFVLWLWLRGDSDDVGWLLPVSIVAALISLYQYNKCRNIRQEIDSFDKNEK